MKLTELLLIKHFIQHFNLSNDSHGHGVWLTDYIMQWNSNGIKKLYLQDNWSQLCCILGI